MTGLASLHRVVEEIHELYRPAARGHWRRRTQRLLRAWLGRPDLELRWVREAPPVDPAPVQLAIPGRSQPPRALRFQYPLSRDEEALARALAPHVGMVVALMERQTAPWNRSLPLRWRQHLTKRQAEVAVLAAAGFSNEQVATMLGNAPRTVARLLQDIYRRLGVNSRTELAAESALGRPPTPFERLHQHGGG